LFFRKFDDEKLKARASDVLLSLTLDASSEYLHIVAQRSLDKILGDADSELHQEKLYRALLITTHNLMFPPNG